jgi:DNA invertase Pin-like site-specific DNA recombinase
MYKIAACYIRVSTDDQLEYSPDSQISKIKEFAQRNGYELPDEYVFVENEGISGRKAEKRPQFMKMIGIAKQSPKPFDAILVWKFSRFARSREDSIVYKSMLRKQHNIDVISVSENIGDDKMSILVEALIEAMDEFYSVNLAEEVTRGMTQRVMKGLPICPPAFGYNIKDKNYYPNEQEAPIVLEIFTRYANGEGMLNIARDLGKRGIRTRQGKMPDNRFIEFMLNNPLYIGRLRWSQNGVRAVSKRDYFNENIIIIDGHHEAIIPMELWEKVQARLRSERQTYAKHAKKGQPIPHMLKGLVRCSDCGGTIAIVGYSSKNKVPCLRCCNYNRGRCHTANGILSTTLENAVIEGLKQAIGSNSFTIAPERRKIETNTPDYDRLIALEERRMERSKQAYLAEIDTIEQYAQNKKEIEARIAELESLKNAAVVPTNYSALKERTIDVVDFLQRDDVTPEAKNEALRTIIDKIVFDKANNSVALYFYD